jgi:hypothetical protein
MKSQFKDKSSDSRSLSGIGTRRIREPSQSTPAGNFFGPEVVLTWSCDYRSSEQDKSPGKWPGTEKQELHTTLVSAWTSPALHAPVG